MEKCSTENVVNNIVITHVVTDGDHTYYGEHFVMYRNVKTLCHTLETNTIFC